MWEGTFSEEFIAPVTELMKEKVDLLMAELLAKLKADGDAVDQVASDAAKAVLRKACDRWPRTPLFTEASEAIANHTRSTLHGQLEGELLSKCSGLMGLKTNGPAELAEFVMTTGIQAVAQRARGIKCSNNSLKTIEATKFVWSPRRQQLPFVALPALRGLGKHFDGDSG